MDRDNPVSRRTVVKLTGIAATTGLVAGCAGPDDGGTDGEVPSDGVDGNDTTDDDPMGNGEAGGDETGGGDDNETGASEDNETEDGNETGDDNESEGGDTGEWEGVDEVVFDGYTDGWEGVSPSPIEGEQNPTIVLFEGQEYDISWGNADGDPHNIEFWDDNEEVVEDYETEILDEEGEGQTLTIEATDEIAEYVCEVHVGTMRGDVQIESGDGGDGDDETGGDGNETDDNETDGDDN